MDKKTKTKKGQDFENVLDKNMKKDSSNNQGLEKAQKSESVHDIANKQKNAVGKNGANITDETDGDTCLHMAVKQGCSIEVVQAIIGHGVDVNATNKKNQAALQMACIKKNEDAINVLLNASADPNIRDGTYGDTCLHPAVIQGCSTEVVQAIIHHGADVNAINKKNQTRFVCLEKLQNGKNSGKSGPLINLSKRLVQSSQRFCLED